MTRKIALLLIGVALSGLAGCENVNDPDDSDSHLGTYTLVSVNGLTIPAFIGFDDQGKEITVVSGRMTLDADMVATDEYLRRLGQGSTATEVTATDNGTYSRSNATITVQWASGSIETFTLNGADLTLQNEFFAAVFRRQTPP